ncbi:hypothetical protein OIDMADRAFT_102909 [Oidiodendron maius Zn]|uniref:Major facilitator superfamily (MFS) profile domain-containing protein n=1 Tax=Oidiodendron maius (strain Zn) TaxID=913774 RepID=A0A0C3HJI5_OIDMZ|nr:hypothetical protein OIDMADRAFT_102909 [Oidiodendron maius Zn]
MKLTVSCALAGLPCASSSTITSTLGLPEAISPNEKVDSVPDGGLRAWLVVFGAWCGLFCSLGWLNSIGTFQSYYQTTLLRQYSASTISWIPSFEIFFTFVMSPVIGRLYDSFGPRYVILGGSILHVFGLMMASISTKYYQLLLSQGVCSALGICAIFQPCMSSIPSWFQHKRGAAYGIASSGTSLGGVIFPIMISQLIRRVGYAWSMRISAFLLLFLLTIVNLTVKSRAPSQRQKISKDTLLQPFREVPMVLLLLGFFFLTFGVFIPINYIVIQAIDDGMSNDLAQYLTALLNAASLFGRLSAGILSDKIGTYNILVSACYFAGILSLALWIPATSNAGIIVFAILFGFASGAYIALAAALVVRICPFKEIGYRTGLLFLVASVSGLAASPIGGAIVHCEGGSYIGMQIFSGVTLLLGSSFVLAARFSKTGLVLWTRF